MGGRSETDKKGERRLRGIVTILGSNMVGSVVGLNIGGWGG